MPRSVLYILAKDPAAGFVKTRLCPPLTAARAAELAAAFAADAFLMAGTLRGIDVRLALDPAPPSGPPPVGGGLAGAAGAAGVTALEGQGDGDLGQRMARLMGRGLAAGPTVLVGTDCPDLPAAVVAEAFEALGRRDVVLVPATDGGYVLVGARRPVPELFAIEAPWSSGRVFEATCDALARAGCTFETLEEREDVDDARALGRLASRLEGARGIAAPETARLLARWRDEGVRF